MSPVMRNYILIGYNLSMEATKKFNIKKDKSWYRILDIIQRLYAGESLSSKDLAMEYNVSRRTICRDINDKISLKQMDIIYEKKGKFGFWKLEDNALRSAQGQDHNNKLAATLLEILTTNLNSELSNAFKPILSQMKDPGKIPVVSMLPIDSPHTQIHNIATLNDPIKNHEIITCFFGNKDRCVHPYKIVNFEKYWYLFCYEPSSQKFKTFSLKDINNIKYINEKFIPSPEASKILSMALNPWFESDKEPFIVRLLGTEKIAKYFQRTPLSPCQNIYRNNDGTVEITLKATCETEIIHEVKKWSPDLMIISPAWLSKSYLDMMEDFIKEQRNLYNSTKDYVD